MSVSVILDVNAKYSNQKKDDYWSGCHFEEPVKLSNDNRGHWGECQLFELIKTHTDLKVFWDGDKNTDPEDGTYDIWIEYPISDKIERIRIEVKTSGRTLSKGIPKGWQHENVYFGNFLCDKYAFFDFDNNNRIYLTIVDYNQIVIDDCINLQIFGKAGHIRKFEDQKAKVDFSLKSLKYGIAADVTFVYDMNNPDNEGLARFLVNKLSYKLTA